MVHEETQKKMDMDGWEIKKKTFSSNLSFKTRTFWLRQDTTWWEQIAVSPAIVPFFFSPCKLQVSTFIMALSSQFDSHLQWEKTLNCIKAVTVNVTVASPLTVILSFIISEFICQLPNAAQDRLFYFSKQLPGSTWNRLSLPWENTELFKTIAQIQGL